MELAWKWGGEVGMDPQDKTLRELHWAVTGRRQAEWDRTSQVLSFIAGHAGTKIGPADLHPYREKEDAGLGGVFAAGRAMLAERKAAGEAK